MIVLSKLIASRRLTQAKQRPCSVSVSLASATSCAAGSTGSDVDTLVAMLGSAGSSRPTGRQAKAEGGLRRQGLERWE